MQRGADIEYTNGRGDAGAVGDHHEMDQAILPQQYRGEGAGSGEDQPVKEWRTFDGSGFAAGW
jgi:hypothetical protein